MSRTIRLAGALALAATLGACDSSSGPANQSAAVQLSLATRAGPGLAPSGPQLSGVSVDYTDGLNTLSITQVQMVVREVELKTVADPAQCDPAVSDDTCEELESGPYLLDLPLSAGASSVVTVDVVPGSYDEFEFKIHKPDDTAENAAFLAINPTFDGVSIRVTGTWNGVAFTYESDLNASQEVGMAPPLVVTDAGTSDFTLSVNIATWFRTSGNMLIDPSTANKGGANENTVKNNIEQSFDAFEDENHNGGDDHSGS
jgi:hypothetical protein